MPNTQLKKYVIIVAGGTGTRMNAAIPKQFLEINGLPILMHTINRFKEYDLNIKIIIVLPENQFSHWKELCKKHKFEITHDLANGGETRFHSVKSGLELIHEVAVIAVHDAVRPLVSKSTITNSFAVAEKKGNAVPVISVNESLREMDADKSKAVDRNKFFIIQTPQCFKSELLFKAYEKEYLPSFTDDASVVESTGEKINLIEGNYENIKITNPKDLIIATALFSSFT